MPCYNQSPEQCRPFFFVPCAFFNSGYAHFFRLGCLERFIPIYREGFGRPVPRSSGAGLEPHGKALGAGGANGSCSLEGEEGIFLKNGPLSPPHHKIFL